MLKNWQQAVQHGMDFQRAKKLTFPHRRPFSYAIIMAVKAGLSAGAAKRDVLNKLLQKGKISICPLKRFVLEPGTAILFYGSTAHNGAGGLDPASASFATHQ